MSVAISTILQVAGIGFIVAVLHTVLESAGKKEFASWTTLTGLILVLLIIVSKLNILFTEITSVFRVQ
jgi:stage III sporulation protein AC